MIIMILAWGWNLLSAESMVSWSGSAYGLYSFPVGSLKNWFQATPNFGFTAGRHYTERWMVEAVFEYSRYDRENLTGYADGKLELELTHWLFGIQGRYRIREWQSVKTYYLLGGGIYKWTGIRGAVAADSSLDLPDIAERKLSETNWGAYTGLGLEWAVTRRLGVEFHTRYRFIVGDLWPTMQPHIELEGVSGFQTLNAGFSLRYYFR